MEERSTRRMLTTMWLHAHIMGDVLKETNPFASDFSPVKAAMEHEMRFIQLAYHFVYQTGFLGHCDLELGWD